MAVLVAVDRRRRRKAQQSGGNDVKRHWEEKKGDGRLEKRRKEKRIRAGRLRISFTDGQLVCRLTKNKPRLVRSLIVLSLSRLY